MHALWLLLSVALAASAYTLCLQDEAVIKLNENTPLLRWSGNAVEVLARFNASDIGLPASSSVEAQLALLQGRVNVLKSGIPVRSVIHRVLNTDLTNKDAQINYTFSGVQTIRTGSKIGFGSGIFTLASGTWRLFALPQVRPTGGTDDLRLQWYNHDPAVDNVIGLPVVATNPLATHRRASQPYAEAFLTVPVGTTTQVSFRKLPLPAASTTTSFSAFADLFTFLVEEL